MTVACGSISTSETVIVSPLSVWMATPGKMLCEAHCSRLKTYGDKVQAPLQAYIGSWFDESHSVGRLSLRQSVYGSPGDLPARYRDGEIVVDRVQVASGAPAGEGTGKLPRGNLLRPGAPRLPEFTSGKNRLNLYLRYSRYGFERRLYLDQTGKTHVPESCLHDGPVRPGGDRSRSCPRTGFDKSSTADQDRDNRDYQKGLYS